jgi:hypothetical protein
MSDLKPLTSGSSPTRKRLVTALESLLYANSINFENMLPAVVNSYDRDTNLATVTPQIMFVDMNDGGVNRNDMASIPCLALGGGGFVINFPIKEGDLGWIHAADRDLRNFKTTLANSKPGSGILHKFSNGMFIPDIFRQYVINAEDSESMVIQTTDGETRIAIKPGQVKITGAALVVDTDLTTFKGEVAMEKSLTVAVEATIASIPFTTHGHIQTAVSGQRTSGGATP